MKPVGLFAGGAPRVRAIPPSARFLDLLADRLCTELGADKDPFALADALVLLPNRRSVRALIEAFAARGAALLLPAIKPLGDVDDDADVWGADPVAFGIPPAIDPLRRRLELAQLIRAKDSAEGGVADPAGAIAAADELCKLLDSASAADNVDWKNLPGLVEQSDLAVHWARSADFLKIVTDYWPARLASEGLADPATRRTLLLEALAKSWRDKPPQTPIIIAGSTGSIGPVRRLMAVVAGLPRGAVILPGLDSDLDDEAWHEIDDQHPQHALKDTLATLKLYRRAVPVLEGAHEDDVATARRALVRETLVPADRTADWLKRLDETAAPWGAPADFIARALDGVSLIEARNEEEEATAIALLLREALETPGRTAALITPDNNLAQRVSAKLRRWNVSAHAAAGVALADTWPGVMLSLLAELAEDDGAPVSLAALLKHKLAQIAPANELAAFENKVLRGPRKHADLTDLRAKNEKHAVVADALLSALAPLRDVFAKGQAQIGALAEALAASAENVCGSRIWAGRAGASASDFLQALAESKDALGAVKPAQVPRLLAALMFGRVAAPEEDGHPRLAIWGPLEARLQHRDLMILGGLNEGAWPAPPPNDPFLSRALRTRLGLPAAEARIGLAAHDFAQLANAPHVVLTRSERAKGAPTIASRWLWRLETLAKAGKYDLRASGAASLALARSLDRPAAITPEHAPRPRPGAKGIKIERLSITDVEKLIRDPYAIYAKRILGLDALRSIGVAPDPRELGNAIHKALEVFSISDAPASDQHSALMAEIDGQLAAHGFDGPQRLAFAARLARAAKTYLRWAIARRARGDTPRLEKRGELAVGDVVVTGIADRIDIRKDGRAEITDYKSGSPPTDKQINSGLAPQLLLEAAMLRAGAIKDTPAADTDALIYWRFAGTNAGERICKVEGGIDAAVQETVTGLADLLAHYAGADAPFLSKPRVEFINDIDDYDQLARRKEWAEHEDIE
jgi:ATP-dependent helicase/nuclease subunit B